MRRAAAIAVIGLGVFCVYPGAPAAVAEDELLKNSGIDQVHGDLPADWYPCFVPGRGTKFRRDTDRFYSQPASLAIEAGPADDQLVATNWAQRIENPPAGKTVRLTARVKTEAAESVNVCVQAWDGSGAKSELIGFESTPVLTGDHDWTLLESRPLVLPRSTAVVIVRAALTGSGKAWFDDIHLVVDDDAKAKAAPATLAPPAAADVVTKEADQAVPRVTEEAVRKELSVRAKGRIVRVQPLDKDATIISYLPDWNHNHVDHFGVSDGGSAGESPTGRGGVRALLEWPSPSAQSIDKTGRRFLLALYARRVTAGGTGPVLVYPILEEWPELTSWKSQPAYADEPSGSIQLGPEMGWKLFDVTAIVRKQAAEPKNFHGVMLRFGNEDHVLWKTSTFVFTSREAEGEWTPLRPMLLFVDP
jgi:hypothetical protein